MSEERISREEVEQLKALIETRFAGDASLVSPYSTDNLTLRLLKDLLAADDALKPFADLAKTTDEWIGTKPDDRKEPIPDDQGMWIPMRMLREARAARLPSEEVK